jgi:excisionase family DNA binding protein
MSTGLVDELADALTSTQAARALRVSMPTIHRWLLDGRLRSIKMPGKRFIPKSAMEEFLAAGTGGGPGTRRATTPKKHARRSEAECKAAAARATEQARRLGC